MKFNYKEKIIENKYIKAKLVREYLEGTFTQHHHRSIMEVQRQIYCAILKMYNQIVYVEFI